MAEIVVADAAPLIAFGGLYSRREPRRRIVPRTVRWGEHGGLPIFPARSPYGPLLRAGR